MVTLSDLSNHRPTVEELADFKQYIMEESDRGSALMAAALVELALTDAIRARIADPGETMTAKWFEGPLAPFGKFADKIELGRALGIYGDHMHERLSMMKSVRNTFAHTVMPLNFQHPAFDEIFKVLTPKQEMLKLPRKILFAVACMALAQTIGNDAAARGGRDMEVTFP